MELGRCTVAPFFSFLKASKLLSMMVVISTKNDLDSTNSVGGISFYLSHSPTFIIYVDILMMAKL